MRIAIIIEGRTECAFIPCLRIFLEERFKGRMPKIDPVPYDGRIPKGVYLKRLVERLLADVRKPADAVIALTDVYTGSRPLDFNDGADARSKMREWVGENNKFFPHAAQYEFEAWLLPYWDILQELSGGSRNAPSESPETVNHNNPPSSRISELFKTGNKRKSYVKTRDAKRVLQKIELAKAASKCQELRDLLDTIIGLCEGDNI
jgi:hypothetical protein